MRVFSDKGDPGFALYCSLAGKGKKIEAYLDGDKVEHCITADDELGLVVRCVLDETGTIQIDPNNLNELWTETVEGDVLIQVRN